MFARLAIIEENCPTKKHFFTLPPTLEEAQIAVKEYQRLYNTIFSNGVKDLAQLVEAIWSPISSTELSTYRTL
jgi:hypothetical protein